MLICVCVCAYVHACMCVARCVLRHELNLCAWWWFKMCMFISIRWQHCMCYIGVTGCEWDFVQPVYFFTHKVILCASKLHANLSFLLLSLLFPLLILLLLLPFFLFLILSSSFLFCVLLKMDSQCGSIWHSSVSRAVIQYTGPHQFL